MKKAYLGIDVAKKKVDVCLLLEAEKWSGQFENNKRGHKKLVTWMTKWVTTHPVHACLEATGRYGEEVATYLHEQGYEVSIMNPARIKKYGDSKLQRNKTDKLDATLIADFVATQNPQIWQPPSEAEKRLHQLVQRRDSLVKQQTQEKNRLKAGTLTVVVRQSIEAHLVFLKEQIKAIDKAIKALIDKDPELKEQRDLVTSIPGIADTTAGILLALLPKAEREFSNKEISAHGGLTPEQLQSGGYQRQYNVLSKKGHIGLRSCLYMPTLSGIQCNPILIKMKQRLEEKGKRPMTIVAACMRKLLVLVNGVLKSKVPFDPNYALRGQGEGQVDIMTAIG